MAEIPTRPRVFLDLQCGAEHFGRLVIELFRDKTPKTCENFRAICSSSFTQPSAMKPLTYKLSPLHRIIDEFMIQGGDITKGDGTGGASIYGGEFEDENIGWRAIDKEGLVCMANRGKGTNSSQFFITLASCEHLNAKHTLFGHVVSGREILDRVAKVPVDNKDRPLSEILIAHCGEVPHNRKNPTTSSELQSSSKIPMDNHNSSTSRGRKRPNSNSPSSSASNSPPPHQPKPTKTSNLNRRRSDVAIDETRRGRTLTRSPSPNHGLSSQNAPSHHQKRRKRSLPPSRSRSPESRSPHLRRRHTRSRSRSQSPRRRMPVRRERQAQHRWRDEEMIRREEEEREGGRGRFEGIIEDGGGGNGYAGGKDGEYGGWRTENGRGEHNGEGRLGGGGGDADAGAEVKFKGRGSMKYREKKW